jgi:addiction module RelE/StbE family toxin
MTIRYSKKFVKQLKKQPKTVQVAFLARIEMFAVNPYEPLLRNHALRGELKGFYSINITGDVRAIYEIKQDEIHIFQLIGSHSQFYG